MRYFALIAALACAACGTINSMDRINLTQFKITGKNAFEYISTVIVPENEDPKTAPIGYEYWLRDWLSENRMCTNGYKIDEVRPVRQLGVLTGVSYNATYIGHCL